MKRNKDRSNRGQNVKGMTSAPISTEKVQNARSHAVRNSLLDSFLVPIRSTCTRARLRHKPRRLVRSRRRLRLRATHSRIRRRQLDRLRLILVLLRQRQTRARIVMLNIIHRAHRARRALPPLASLRRRPTSSTKEARGRRRVGRRRARVEARRRPAQRARVVHRPRCRLQAVRRAAVERRVGHHEWLGLVVLRELVPPHDARGVLALVVLVGINEVNRALFVPALRAPAAPPEEPQDNNEDDNERRPPSMPPTIAPTFLEPPLLPVPL